jgi:hypothetical protein
VQQYLAENNYDLPVYYLAGAVDPGFEVSSIPTTFLISKDLKIVSRKKGATNWNSRAFKEQLDQLISQ